jgi:hypothetical protein
LPIDDFNRAYAEIEIRKHDNAGYEPIKFKYDPGADISTISLDDLESLGYAFADVEQLAQLSGTGSAATGPNTEHYAINLNLTHIFGQLVPKGLTFPFACLCKRNVPIPKNANCKGCDLTGKQVGGFRSLLGNDILSCFDVQINRTARQIVLSKISDLTERNKMYVHCQVYELENR